MAIQMISRVGAGIAAASSAALSPVGAGVAVVCTVGAYLFRNQLSAAVARVMRLLDRNVATVPAGQAASLCGQHSGMHSAVCTKEVREVDWFNTDEAQGYRSALCQSNNLPANLVEDHPVIGKGFQSAICNAYEAIYTKEYAELRRHLIKAYSWMKSLECSGFDTDNTYYIGMCKKLNEYWAGCVSDNEQKSITANLSDVFLTESLSVIYDRITNKPEAASEHWDRCPHEFLMEYGRAAADYARAKQSWEQEVEPKKKPKFETHSERKEFVARMEELVVDQQFMELIKLQGGDGHKLGTKLSEALYITIYKYFGETGADAKLVERLKAVTKKLV